MAQELPAFLQRLMPAGQAIGAASVSGITGFPQPPHISIRGNRFHLVDAQGQEETVRDISLEVVIVDANPFISRIYFGQDYDPATSEAAPPKCFSDNGTAPSVQAMVPQHNNCAGCPQAVWGSAVSKLNGKPIPACSTRKKLALLYNGELFQLVIPPASLGNWKEYYGIIARIPNVGVNMIKTLIAFDEKKTGILTFTASDFLDEATANSVFQISQTKEHTVKLIGGDDVPLTDFTRIGASAKVPSKDATVYTPPGGFSAPGPTAPITERIVNLQPDMTAIAQQQFGEPVSLKPKRKRNVVAGARQQLEASVEDTAPSGHPDTPPAQPAAFGMVEPQAASNDDQLKALLAKAVGFANKQ